MKIALTILLVFLGAILAEGIIVPSLLHIPGGFLVFAFLATLLVVYGIEPTILIFAVAAAFILELWHGWYLGSVMLAVLAAAFIWQWMSSFFNIEPFIKHSRTYTTSLVPLLGLGYVLVASMSIVFLFIEKYVYRIEVSWATLRMAAVSPAMWLTTGIGIVVCLLLLRMPGYQSMPASGKFYI